MAWRMITPLDLHCSILLDTGSEPTCSPGKRRRSSGRKKSSKSESEQDAVVNSETAQEGSEAENGEPWSWFNYLLSWLRSRQNHDIALASS